MLYSTNDNFIKVSDKSQFNPKHILECGQIFRYYKDGDEYVVFSKEFCARIKEHPDYFTIHSNNIKYFQHFFDLRTDYRKIKQTLYETEFMRPAMIFGGGLRILHQDPFETVVSFIISANNNIKRISASIEYLCTHFGSNMGEFFAFPTIEQLLTASVDDFKLAGLGYRADQLFRSLRMLQYVDLNKLRTYTLVDKKKLLKSLIGVGDKVADCILLFAYAECGSFPVDTWINKVYNDYFKTTESNRVHIGEVLKNVFGVLSGYAQQYLFYYYRSKPKLSV